MSLETLHTDQAPAAIGPYRVVGQIAEHDLTSVYLCEQEKPVRRRAAVKVLHSAVHRREVLKRFEWERQAIASLPMGQAVGFQKPGAGSRQPEIPTPAVRCPLPHVRRFSGGSGGEFPLAGLPVSRFKSPDVAGWRVSSVNEN